MRLIAILVVLALALAGCSDDGPDSGSNTGTNSPSPTATGTSNPQPPVEPITKLNLLSDFSFTGCDGAWSAHTTTLESAQALIPDNYSVVSPTSAQGVGSATLEVHLYRCANFAAASSNFSDVTLGWITATIFPPETADAYLPELEPGNGIRSEYQHQYIIQMLAAPAEEDILGLLWPAAGYPTYIGAADYTTTDTGGAVYQDDFSLGDYQLAGATAGPSYGALEGPLALWHDTEDGSGTITWHGWPNHINQWDGAGTLSFPADSPLASVQPEVVALTSGMHRTIDYSFEDLQMVLHLSEPL